MGNESDLWDDSALLNAFDKAIAKYKKMHSPDYQPNPSEDEEVASGYNETGPHVIDNSRILEYEGNSSSVSNNAAETYAQHDNLRSSGELPSTEGDHIQTEMPAPQPYVDCSSTLPVQETVEGNSIVQGEEYKKLLGEYYALEAQRQRLLLQLHQATGWNNYQSFSACWDSCGPCYMCCEASQANQVPAHDMPCPDHPSTCCPYCSYLPPLTPLTPASVLGGQSMPSGGTCTAATSQITDPGKFSPFSDDKIVKIAMGAVEKAITSMKGKASATSGINQVQEADQVKGKTQNLSTQEVGVPQNASPQTDLNEVLNAWFSAGFHTGKYLAEQSLAKDQV